MANETVDVYYIGRKPRGRDDSLFRNKHRFWPKFGASIPVPAEEAQAYFFHADEWADKDGYLKAREQRQQDENAQAEADAKVEKDIATKGKKASEPAPKTAKVEGPPQQQDEREVMISSAIMSLKPGDEKDFTTTGKPRVERVVELVGTNVSADEISNAVKALRLAGKLK